MPITLGDQLNRIAPKLGDIASGLGMLRTFAEKIKAEYPDAAPEADRALGWIDAKTAALEESFDAVRLMELGVDVFAELKNIHANAFKTSPATGAVNTGG